MEQRNYALNMSFAQVNLLICGAYVNRYAMKLAFASVAFLACNGTSDQEADVGVDELRDQCTAATGCTSDQFCGSVPIENPTDPLRLRRAVCVPRRGEGEQCSKNPECRTEFFCDTTADAAVDWVCVPRRGEGEPCDDESERHDQCVEGLFCAGYPDHGCTPRVPPGEPGKRCGKPDPCAAGATCVELIGRCAAPGQAFGPCGAGCAAGFTCSITYLDNEADRCLPDSPAGIWAVWTGNASGQHPSARGFLRVDDTGAIVESFNDRSGDRRHGIELGFSYASDCNAGSTTGVRADVDVTGQIDVAAQTIEIRWEDSEYLALGDTGVFAGELSGELHGDHARGEAEIEAMGRNNCDSTPRPKSATISWAIGNSHCDTEDVRPDQEPYSSYCGPGE